MNDVNGLLPVGRLQTGAVEKVVHIHPDAYAGVPGGLNLEVDPLTAGCVRADQHNRAGLAGLLRDDPVLDRLVTTRRDALPVVIRHRLVTLEPALRTCATRQPSGM